MVNFVKNPYATAKPLDPMFTVGKKLRTVQAKIVLDGTADGDVVILAEGLPATARIARIMLPKGVSAISGVGSVDFGFYATNTNKGLDIDAVARGVSFTSAKGNVDLVGYGYEDFDATKDIATLCGLDSQNIPANGFNLCATLLEKGEATETIELDILIEQD